MTPAEARALSVDCGRRANLARNAGSWVECARLLGDAREYALMALEIEAEHEQSLSSAQSSPAVVAKPDAAVLPAASGPNSGEVA